MNSQGSKTANARRKYLHVKAGGIISAQDMANIVADMEAQDSIISALEVENMKLREQRIADSTADRRNTE